jgi:hypothetical protein
MEHTEERKNESGSECWCGCKRFRDPDAYRLKQASKKRGSEKMRELKEALAKAQRRATDAEAKAVDRERDARRAEDRAMNAQRRVSELQRLVDEEARGDTYARESVGIASSDAGDDAHEVKYDEAPSILRLKPWNQVDHRWGVSRDGEFSFHKKLRIKTKMTYIGFNRETNTPSHYIEDGTEVYCERDMNSDWMHKVGKLEIKL